MNFIDLVRSFLTLGVIVGALPNNIVNGTTIDAVPVMANYNWIVNQVNANAAPASTAVTTTVLGSGSGAGTVGFTQSGTGAAPQTVQAKERQIVSILDFYANAASGPLVDPTGVTDSTLGIQAAFNTQVSIFSPPGTFKVTAIPRMQVSGQMLYGSGASFGNDGSTVTTWKYSGGLSATAACISFRPQTTGAHVSNCGVKDIAFDANSLAGMCVQGYDTANDPGIGLRGTWRNFLSNVHCKNATTVGVEWGHTGTAPAFANDCYMLGGSIWNCVIGWAYNGSTLSYYNTTVSQNSNCGGYMQAGAQASMENCIYNANGFDFKCYNIQLLNVQGGWYENSTGGVLVSCDVNGVYPVSGTAPTNGAYNFNGAFLFTSNVTGGTLGTGFLMDFGSVAGGQNVVGCFFPAVSLPGGKTSNLIVGINGTYGVNTTGSTAIATTVSIVSQAWPTLAPTLFGGDEPSGILHAGTKGGAGLGAGATLTIPLITGNTIYHGLVAVMNRSAALATSRTYTLYSVSYFNADNTKITALDTQVGSNGAYAFTLGFSGANMTITNNGAGASWISWAQLGMAGF